MATTAAVLDIVIRANTGKATANLRKTDQTLRRTEKAGMRASSAFRKMAGAAIAAGGAYVGIHAAKKAITTTEDLAKTTLSLHKNLGMSVKSASEFASVLKVRGVEGQKVNMAFGTLSKNIRNAGQGSKSATKNFRELGISQDELRKLKPDQLMGRIADGMKKLGPGAERTAIGMQLFGRGWQALMPVLRDGSKSMQDQLKLANKYGASFGGKSLKSMEDLIKAQRELKFAQLGLQIAFTTRIAPALLKVADAGAKVIRIMRDPNLTADQKWSRMGRVIGGLGTAMQQVFEKAAPRIAEAAAKAAPRVAGAFVSAFTQANVWGKLIIGGWLLSKFGGRGAVTATGATLGRWLGGGIAASTATEAATGSAAGGAGMIGMLRGKVFPVARRLGLVGMGLVLADQVMSEFGRRAETKSPDIFKALKAKSKKNLGANLATTALGPFGGKLFGEDDRKRAKDLIKALDDIDKKGRGINTGKARELRLELHRLGGVSLDARHQFNALINSAVKKGSDLRFVRNEFGRMRAGAVLSVKEMRHVTADNFARIARSMGVNSAKGKDAVRTNFRLGLRAIKNFMSDGTLSTAGGMREIRRLLRVHSKGGTASLKTNFAEARGFIARTMRNSKGITKEGMQAIRSILRKELALYGLSGDQIRTYLRGPRAGGNEPAGRTGIKYRRGGFISVGKPSGDSVHAMLEKGEGVINRNAVKAMGGPEAIHAINRSAPRFQQGGVPGYRRGGTVPRMVVAGPDSPLKAVDQKVLDIDRAAANRKLARAKARYDAATSGGGTVLGKGKLSMYAFPLPQFGSEGRVDRGQDMEASKAHATTVAVGHGKVVNAGIGFPGIQIRLSRGPLAGNTAFYGHNNAVFTKLGANVRPGQAVGQTGNPIGGGGPTHTEIGFMQGYGSQSGHWTGPGSAGGMLMHNLLHRIAPGRIGAPAKMARGGIVGMAAGGIAGLKHAKHHKFSLPELRALWVAAGGNFHKATTMGHIAIAESGLGTGHGKPWAHNSSGATGLWQILGGAGDLYDPWVNATNAVAKYRGGGLNPWVSSRSNWGRWAGFYDRRRPALLRGGAGGRRGSTRQTRLPPALPVRGLGAKLRSIKKLGLPKSMTDRLARLGASADKFGEWASRAQTLNLEGDDTTAGVPGTVFGHNETFWLQKQLDNLFWLRHYLIRAHAKIAKTRKYIKNVLLKKARKHLRALRKHPVLNRDRIKAYKNKVIPALKKRYSDLGGTDTDLMSRLTDVQGAGSTMKLFKVTDPSRSASFLPPVGELGGSIFEVQSRLRELGAKTTVSPAAADTSERLQSMFDLSQETVRSLNLEKAVRESAFQVFRDLPYAGSFGGGGVVPGPVGRPMAATVHGGEVIGQPGNVQVTVVVEKGAGVDESKIRVIARDETGKELRTQVRRAGRTPGVAGR